jgi:hypothetical protein
MQFRFADNAIVGDRLQSPHHQKYKLPHFFLLPFYFFLVPNVLTADLTGFSRKVIGGIFEDGMVAQAVTAHR